MQVRPETTTRSTDPLPDGGCEGKDASGTTNRMGEVAQTLTNWKGRKVFFREQGEGYTDAYVTTIDSLSYSEDAEAYECEHGFHTDMLLLLYLDGYEADYVKVFGYAGSLISSDVDGSVLTFGFRDSATYTIALLSEVSEA